MWRTFLCKFSWNTAGQGVGTLFSGSRTIWDTFCFEQQQISFLPAFFYYLIQSFHQDYLWIHTSFETRISLDLVEPAIWRVLFIHLFTVVLVCKCGPFPRPFHSPGAASLDLHFPIFTIQAVLEDEMMHNNNWNAKLLVQIFQECKYNRW